MKKVAGFRRDVGHVSGPHRHRHQHHVHGREASHRERADEPLHLALLRIVGAARIERMPLEANGIELTQDTADIQSVTFPLDHESSVGEVKACFRHPRERADAFLDGVHAGRAAHAFDGKLHPAQPVGRTDKGGVIALQTRARIRLAPRSVRLYVGLGDICAAHRSLSDRA